MLHSYNDDELMINSYNKVFKKVGQEWPIILCWCLHLLRTSSTRSIVISFFPELSKEVIIQNFLLPKILDKNSLPLCHSCWSEWRPEQECFVSLRYLAALLVGLCNAQALIKLHLDCGNTTYSTCCLTVYLIFNKTLFWEWK